MAHRGSAARIGGQDRRRAERAADCHATAPPPALSTRTPSLGRSNHWSPAGAAHAGCDAPCRTAKMSGTGQADHIFDAKPPLLGHVADPLAHAPVDRRTHRDTVPRSGASRPPIIRIVVVLPAPLRPTNPNRRPANREARAHRCNAIAGGPVEPIQLENRTAHPPECPSRQSQRHPGSCANRHGPTTRLSSRLRTVFEPLSTHWHQ